MVRFLIPKRFLIHSNTSEFKTISKTTVNNNHHNHESSLRRETEEDITSEDLKLLKETEYSKISEVTESSDGNYTISDDKNNHRDERRVTFSLYD